MGSNFLLWFEELIRSIYHQKMIIKIILTLLFWSRICLVCPCPPRDLSCSSSILIVYSFKTSFGRSNKYFIGDFPSWETLSTTSKITRAAMRLFKNFFIYFALFKKLEWIECKIKSKIQSKNHTSARRSILLKMIDVWIILLSQSSLLIKTSHEFCWTRSRSLWIILKSSFCQRHDWLEHDLRIEEVNIESTSQVWENKTRKLWSL